MERMLVPNLSSQSQNIEGLLPHSFASYQNIIKATLWLRQREALTLANNVWQ